jgi:uncharacterized Zn finger protein
MRYDGWGWRPYVPVADRRRKALAVLEKRRKKGEPVQPVEISGRTIASTFWGKAWCDNLERYSDYANRLPRGRTYVRNGSVVHLEVAPGRIEALVSGSSLYKVSLEIAAVPARRWKSICQDCAGGIDSLVELLQGRLSKGVMERICRQTEGLFPSPSEIRLSCSCPDWAEMCKHVAAVLYGVGARLDRQPELLFLLRGVDQRELIETAGEKVPATVVPTGARVLDSRDLGDIFGIELAATEVPPAATGPKPAKRSAARARPEKTPEKAPKASGRKKVVKKAAKKAKKKAPAKKPR